jgi:hypothetical protein
MAYVIYDKASTKLKGKAGGYKTSAAAARALTLMEKARRASGDHDPANHCKVRFAIADDAYFYGHIEKRVMKTNLMTGKQYMESVNTPLACSPASETYWSM